MKKSIGSLLAVFTLSLYCFPVSAEWWGRHSCIMNFMLYETGFYKSCFDAAATIILFILFFYRIKGKIVNLYSASLLFFLVLWHAVSGMLGEGNTYSSANSCRVATSMLSGLLVATFLQSSRAFLNVITILAATVGATNIYLYIIGDNIIFSGHLARAVGAFSQPSAILTLSMVAAPSSLVFSFVKINLPQRFFWTVIFSIVMTALALTWYRSAMLAFSVVIIFTAIKVGAKRIIIYFITLMCVLLLLYTFYIRTSDEINVASTLRSNSGHRELLQLGFNDFKEHWLSGVGVGNVVINADTIVDGKTEQIGYMDPSNLYVFYLEELGVVGSSLLILLGFNVFLLLQRDPTITCVATRSSYIGLLILGFFETPFGPANSLVGNVIISALVGLSISEKLNTSPNQHTS